MKLSGIVKYSIVDGPGINYVVFTQGCLHKCKGCHNPQTHDINGGYEETIENIVEDIRNTKGITGVTLSGGDPLYQVEDSYKLLLELKKLGYRVICYTGFTFEELYKMDNPVIKNFIMKVDLLVDGPFILEQKTMMKPFVGSSNQRVLSIKDRLNIIRSLEKNG